MNEMEDTVSFFLVLPQLKRTLFNTNNEKKIGDKGRQQQKSVAYDQRCDGAYIYLAQMTIIHTMIIHFLNFNSIRLLIKNEKKYL